MIAVTDADAAVVGSCLVFLLGVAGLYVQNRRGISSQRGDHAATASIVREIHSDVREMKADVMDVKAEVRSHGERLRSLEHMTITQDHTDRIVADNGRKLQFIQDHKEQAS